jgi:excisionase family DNA binding protein
MTVAEAARAIGCSPRHVRTLIVQGKLRARKHERLYDLSPREVYRYWAEPQGRGFPRGRKRATSRGKMI